MMQKSQVVDERLQKYFKIGYDDSGDYAVVIYPMTKKSRSILSKGYIILPPAESRHFVYNLNMICGNEGSHISAIVSLLSDTQQLSGINLPYSATRSYCSSIAGRFFSNMECEPQLVAASLQLFFAINYGFTKYSSRFYERMNSKMLAEHTAKILITLRYFNRDRRSGRDFMYDWDKSEKPEIKQITFAEEFYRLQYSGYEDILPVLEAHCCVTDIKNKTKNMEELDMQLESKPQLKNKLQVVANTSAVDNMKASLGVVAVRINKIGKTYHYFITKDQFDKLEKVSNTEGDLPLVLLPANPYSFYPFYAEVCNYTENASSWATNKATTPILDVVAESELLEKVTGAQKLVDDSTRKAEIMKQLDERYALASKESLWRAAAEHDPVMKKLLDELSK